MGIFSLMTGLNACKGKQEKQDAAGAVDAAHNSRNSLNWDGVYTGITPCADCPGIRTKIVLNGDNTYTVSREYMDSKDAVYNYSGSFDWSEDGGAVSLKEDERSPAIRFKVGEDALIQLDMEGNVITGDLADNYILVKAGPDLLEKHWKLAELSGKPAGSGSPKEAFIVFKQDDNQVTGNMGCNDTHGTYWLTANNGLSFSQMASTSKMCLNMDVEEKLKGVFANTESYTLRGDTLALEGETSTLARFVAVTE